MARILAFAGSARSASLNKQLIRVAVSGARLAGAEVMVVDLRDLPMPIYDGDLEAKEGLPANAKAFKNLLKSHQGLLISSPEYNSSLPALLKNAIDWASRPLATNVLRNKPVAVIGASTGAFGAVWAQAELRKVLAAAGARVLDAELAVGHAPERFDASGRLADPELREQLGEVLELLREAAGARGTVAAA
jgi:chromate reductase